jgi:hypothetical protein
MSHHVTARLKFWLTSTSVHVHAMRLKKGWITRITTLSVISCQTCAYLLIGDYELAIQIQEPKKPTLSEYAERQILIITGSYKWLVYPRSS